MLETNTGTTLCWQNGQLVIAKVHLGIEEQPNVTDVTGAVSLLDALSLCGGLFPDRKAKHAKNKLKLRRSSKPSSSHTHSDPHCGGDDEVSSDLAYGFGFGLSERRCCSDKTVSWLDFDLRVGDKIVSVNGETVQEGLMEITGETIELSILRHNPISTTSHVSTAHVSTQSSDESSTQTKTQSRESSDSEGMSDLDEGSSDMPTVVPVDLDLKRRVGSMEALASLQRLFAKKLSQVVGMWVKDTNESLWGEMCARRRNFDKLRLNYTAHYVSTWTSDYGFISLNPTTSGANSGYSEENGKQTRETLEKVLTYALSIKESRRDRVSALLTGALLCGVVDTLVTHVFMLRGDRGTELKSLLSTAYDKYLISTDPTTFPTHSSEIERRCSACLTLTASLFHKQTTVSTTTSTLPPSELDVEVEYPSAKRQRNATPPIVLERKQWEAELRHAVAVCGESDWCKVQGVCTSSELKLMTSEQLAEEWRAINKEATNTVEIIDDLL